MSKINANKHSTIRRYKPLIHELVVRDLKVKYRRSFLGYLWSLLNPLLMMGVLSFVFSNMFRANVENYPLYLICGQTLFNFFSESTNMSMYSVLQNGALIKKIYIPKFIFPVSRVVSSFVTMSFSLTAIILVMIFTGAPFYWTILLSPVPIFLLLLFCCGIGMMLSALSVYFRDITHLWGVVTLAWMYATPIFYTLDMMPEDLVLIMKSNPLFHFIDLFRSLVMLGEIPEIAVWINCVAAGVIALCLGMLAFNRLQKNFILHI